MVGWGEVGGGEEGLEVCEKRKKKKKERKKKKKRRRRKKTNYV